MPVVGWAPILPPLTPPGRTRAASETKATQAVGLFVAVENETFSIRKPGSMAANRRDHFTLAPGKELCIEASVTRPENKQNAGGDSGSIETWKMRNVSGPEGSKASFGAWVVAHMGMSAWIES